MPVPDEKKSFFLPELNTTPPTADELEMSLFGFLDPRNFSQMSGSHPNLQALDTTAPSSPRKSTCSPSEQTSNTSKSIRSILGEMRDARKGIARTQRDNIIFRDARKIKITEYDDENNWFESYALQGWNAIESVLHVFDLAKKSNEDPGKPTNLQNSFILNKEIVENLLAMYKHFYLLAKLTDEKEDIGRLVRQFYREVENYAIKKALEQVSKEKKIRQQVKKELKQQLKKQRFKAGLAIEAYDIITLTTVNNDNQKYTFFDWQKPLLEITPKKTEDTRNSVTSEEVLVCNDGTYKIIKVINATQCTIGSASKLPRNWQIELSGKLKENEFILIHQQGHSGGLPNLPQSPIDRLGHLSQEQKTTASDNWQQITEKYTQNGIEAKNIALQTLVNEGLLEKIILTDDRSVQETSAFLAQKTFYSNYPVNNPQQAAISASELIIEKIINEGNTPKEIKKFLKGVIIPEKHKIQYINALTDFKTIDDLRKKRLFAAAIEYRAIQLNMALENSLKLPTFIQEKDNYNLHLAALEAIMYYNQSNENWLQHTTCKSGKDRTFLLLMTIRHMLRFFDLTGKLLPNPNDSTETELFKTLVKTEIAAGSSQLAASLGGTLGCYGIIPSNKAIPSYYDTEQVKKQLKLKSALNRKGFKTQKSDIQFGTRFEIDNPVRWQKTLLSELKTSVKQAITCYQEDYAVQCVFIEFASFHDDEGQERVEKLDKIMDEGNLAKGLQALYEVLKASGNGKYSFANHLRKELDKAGHENIKSFLAGNLEISDQNYTSWLSRRSFRTTITRALKNNYLFFNASSNLSNITLGPGIKNSFH